jgi:hypothetical protein
VQYADSRRLFFDFDFYSKINLDLDLDLDLDLTSPPYRSTIAPPP